MIKNLRIKNYRSLLNSEINLHESGLNILIGANGAGKSNVVKALEFISNLHTDNLSSAIASQHGHFSIIPKSINNESLTDLETEFDYTIEIPSPPDYPEEKEPPTGSHLIKFRWNESPDYSITSESLTFSEPLAVAYALQNQKDDEKSISKKFSHSKSTIRFIRKDSGIEVRTWPNFNNKTRKAYIYWMGLNIPALEKEFKSVRNLNTFLEDFSQRVERRGQNINYNQSIVNWERNIINFSAQSYIFRDAAQKIKRFDLRLSELRKEQQVNREKSLHKFGTNIPTTLRWIQQNTKTNISWERLLSTMKDIAPHIYDIQTERLKTGRDYIQFLETKTGRPVESWDSSDGTLRALAVLLAIESTEEFGTVILEEPEIGLHPWAIRYLMDHIRQSIQRKMIQVIITTHSEHILESASPEEVLVVTRDMNEGSKVNKLKELMNIENIKKGDVGRLWVKGLLGATP